MKTEDRIKLLGRMSYYIKIRGTGCAETFAQKINTSRKSTANYAVTNLVSGNEFSFGGVGSVLTGALLNTALPEFSGVSGGSLNNIIAEGIHQSTTGALVGGVSGGIGALVDGESIHEGITNGIKGGVLAGLATASVNNIFLGAAYVPDAGLDAYDNSTDHNRPVFRRGPFWYPNINHGLTLGRNLITNNPNSHRLRRHEYYHFVQQNELGIGTFYGRVVRQMFQHGFNGAYGEPGTLENDAVNYENY